MISFKEFITEKSKIELAREIAARSKPRFIEIPRKTRSTAYNALVKQHPEIEEKQKASMKAKEREEKRVSKHKKNWAELERERLIRTWNK